ncbi:acetolactate synthase small subunit [Paenibacillus sp. UNC451MF]|uniref:acetolactate synthase small subunit n=1 Tax=Paenibacillus sp. UNC451MF TaxID=1449063 RepID=UPI00049003B1|nr:acetolactate synthase small subunit [Paenibacillus sp. UNC451MF]
MMRKHTLAILVNDQPGVLQRVCGLFGRRGFNIDSISVGGTEESGLSRMTVVTTGDDRTIEQIEKQLSKLIDVIRIQDVSSKPMVSRELALIKLEAEPSIRPEILGIVETFRASVIDVGPKHMIIQAVGDLSKLDAIIELLRPYGISELSYTGATAMTRGS